MLKNSETAHSVNAQSSILQRKQIITNNLKYNQRTNVKN